MRKSIAFLCMVATLISFSSCQRNYTHAVYEVSIVAKLIYNHSVGNDWKKSYTCNGRTIADGEEWTVPLDTTETIKVNATVTEIDEWNDIGYGSASVTLSDGYKTSTHITVIENKGRYNGNKALWEIIFKVKLIDNILIT
ncbi:MAG: hypothetical protein IJD45_06270 [Clostridia bacterium]|nr:hypothetical protein [Clostridia bacterium]